MKLRCLQVKNFRCIEDSTEFTVCPVTCLVGKNGAGKTSLLDALHKLNPDVAEMGSFDVLMEYPRSRRRDYQKRAQEQPDDALIATWELEDKDVATIENELGRGAVKSITVIVRKGYYPGRLWSAGISDRGRATVPPDEQQESQETSPASPDQESPISSLRSQIPDVNSDDSGEGFFETHLAKLLPKLLYFSEWHIMRGRISIDALLQRKQRGELTGPDRVFLALLQLGGTSPEALTRIERSEEPIADLGTKVSEEAMSTDYDTLLPLQASLGYRIVRDLTGDRRLLLVEKPADAIYLHWFSARLNEQGRAGLEPDWTITPCGNLTRLATLAGLLTHEPSRFAALLSLSNKHPDVVGHPVLARILERSNTFALHTYAEPMESTIEDLIGPAAYLALVDLSYGIPRKQRLSRVMDADTSAPLLKWVSEQFAAHRPTAANFDPMTPAEHLLTGGRKARKLPGMDEALSRFERLFADLNARP